MYIFPGYIKYYEKGGAIYISSKLLQNKVALTDSSIQEEFRILAKSGGCSELSTSLTQFLHEQELLLDGEEIRSTLIETKKLLNSIMMLTIMPTEGCNFRCPYCYECHSPVSMRRETLDRIQEYITRQAPHFQTINISWFGGEPTLCKDVILETNHLVRSIQSKYGFRFNSAMTTNGYLLNEENFREYYAAGITRYQVTLDGWDHNKTRPHVSGKGTLQPILDNLTVLSALPPEEYSFHIMLRRNLLAGDMEFTWYDHLYDLFGRDDRFFMSVVPVGDWGGKTVKTMDLISAENRSELILAHKAYIDKLGMQWENQEKNLFSNVCYASYPYGFVFRADGRIEKCTVALDQPRNLVGYVDPDKGLVLDNEANLVWSPDDLKPECYVCPDVLSCFNLTCRKGVIMHGHQNGVCPRVELAAIE